MVDPTVTRWLAHVDQLQAELAALGTRLAAIRAESDAVARLIVRRHAELSDHPKEPE